MLHAAMHRMEESLKTIVWDSGVLDIRGSVHKTKGEWRIWEYASEYIEEVMLDNTYYHCGLYVNW